ncbi:MAG: hypothetical protein AB7R89_34690 [Dehalococcoidia bacterium]
MIVITAPVFPWQEKRFACPRCKGVVQFEISDLTGLKAIKPKQAPDGSYRIQTQCEWCRTVETFREVEEAA